MSRRVKLLVLSLVFTICLVAAGVQWTVRRQREAQRPGELFDVVWQQIAAVRTDDYASAYRQVSSGFQEKFDMEAFSELARSDYPAQRRAERVEFGPVQRQGDHAVVPVYFFMPEGDVAPCLYSLVREDRTWKIDSIRMQKRWPAGRRLGGMRT